MDLYLGLKSGFTKSLDLDPESGIPEPTVNTLLIQSNIVSVTHPIYLALTIRDCNCGCDLD
jgi:hypothetical protein